MSSVATKDVVADALLKAWPKAIPTATRYAKLAGCSPDDLLQEAFLTALEVPDRVNLNHPENSFRAIVRNVGRRAAAKHLRRLKGVDPQKSEDINAIADLVSGDVSDQAAKAEIVAAVREEIQSLPLTQQTVIKQQLDGATLVETAEIAGKSNGAVTKDKVRAQDRLRRSGRLRRIVESWSLLPWLGNWRTDPKSGLTLASSLTLVAALTMAGVWYGLSLEEPSTGSDIHNVGTRSLVSSSDLDHVRSRPAGSNAQPQTAGLRPQGLPLDEGGHGANHLGKLGTTVDSSSAASSLEFNGVDPQASGQIVPQNVHRFTPIKRVDPFPDGKPFLEWYEVEGKKHGEQTTYRRDGTRAQTLEFVEGKIQGRLTEYRPDGITISRWMQVEGNRVIYQSAETP